jgi:dCTP deaminase
MNLTQRVWGCRRHTLATPTGGIMLSDASIRRALLTGELAVDPMPPDEAFQPASLDLHLGSMFAMDDPRVLPRSIHLGCVPGCMCACVAPERRLQKFHIFDGTFHLQPHAFALAHTVEVVALGRNLAGQLHGKSTLGRVGLAVHITAGFIDPGFAGQLTLELFNCSTNILYMEPGLPVAQLTFERVDRAPIRLYGDPALHSRYQGQAGAQGAVFNGSAVDVAVAESPEG